MQSIRNIAIIAHVDHGKTTLVDKIIHASKIFRENQEFGDLILDNNDLERERGITIVSKNVSVRYNGVKINIIDMKFIKNYENFTEALSFKNKREEIQKKREEIQTKIYKIQSDINNSIDNNIDINLEPSDNNTNTNTKSIEELETVLEGLKKELDNLDKLYA